MNVHDIFIENEVIQYIISKYSLNINSGVRELEQVLNKIFTRINLYKNIVLKKNNIGNILLLMGKFEQAQ
jgi:ATP-dependent Lon protease